MKHNSYKIILMCLLTATCSLSLYSQAEGESEARTIIIKKSAEPAAEPEAHTADTLTIEEMNIEDRYHALIIGINSYRDPALMDLDNPIRDADSLYKTLTTNYMFKPDNVILLKDPTRADIIKQLDR